MKKHKLICLLIAMVLIYTSVLAVSAASVPYQSYTYNKWGEPVSSPSGYEPLRIITGESLKVGSFYDPSDMMVAPNGKTYILDKGNNRVVIADSALNSATELKNFITKDKKPYKLSGATGIYVDNKGYIYIADTGNKVVIKCDEFGNIVRSFTKPNSPIFGNLDFSPNKVTVDKTGNLYVLCRGISNGAVMFDQTGKFLGFFGSNQVDVTLQLMTDRFLKSFMTTSQKSKIPNYIPVEYTNLVVDSENFVYTCTLNTQNSSNLIRKINPLGINILQDKLTKSFQKSFGDPEVYYNNGIAISTSFIDLSVHEMGHISALDFTRGRIFQYDQDANLIFVFGGKGNQLGMFVYPIAMDHKGSDLLVLDNTTVSITQFTLTEFGKSVNKGIELYNEGKYIDSIGPWNDVLKYNSNYNLAYIGLGKAELELGNYKEAMNNFKIGQYTHGYDVAYAQYRRIDLRRNFPYVFGLTILLLFLIFTSQIPVFNKLYSKIIKGIKKLFINAFNRIFRRNVYDKRV